MISIAKAFEWDMGHRVTNHASLCKNLHGHRYKMIVRISGPIQDEHGIAQQGMVLDFGILKKVINEQVVDTFDHAFMYWEQDKVIASFASQNKNLKMYAMPFVPTAECIAQYLADQLITMFAKTLPDITLVSLQLFETPKSQALWEREESKDNV